MWGIPANPPCQQCTGNLQTPPPARRSPPPSSLPPATTTHIQAPLKLLHRRVHRGAHGLQAAVQAGPRVALGKHLAAPLTPVPCRGSGERVHG